MAISACATGIAASRSPRHGDRTALISNPRQVEPIRLAVTSSRRKLIRFSGPPDGARDALASWSDERARATVRRYTVDIAAIESGRAETLPHAASEGARSWLDDPAVVGRGRAIQPSGRKLVKAEEASFTSAPGLDRDEVPERLPAEQDPARLAEPRWRTARAAASPSKQGTVLQSLLKRQPARRLVALGLRRAQARGRPQAGVVNVPIPIGERRSSFPIVDGRLAAGAESLGYQRRRCPPSVGSGAAARSTSADAVRGWAPGMRLGRARLHGRAGPLGAHSGCLASASACAERSAAANSEARAAQADSPSRSNRPAAWSCARAASKCMSSDLNQANRATPDSADATGPHYFARRRGRGPTRSQRYQRMQTAWTESWWSEAWGVVTRLTGSGCRPDLPGFPRPGTDPGTRAKWALPAHRRAHTSAVVGWAPSRASPPVPGANARARANYAAAAGQLWACGSPRPSADSLSRSTA